MIGLIREDQSNGNIVYCRHSFYRMEELAILSDEVEKAILHGEIIESYEDDFP